MEAINPQTGEQQVLITFEQLQALIKHADIAYQARVRNEILAELNRQMQRAIVEARDDVLFRESMRNPLTRDWLYQQLLSAGYPQSCLTVGIDHIGIKIRNSDDQNK